MSTPLTVVHDRALASYCISVGERYLARASYLFHCDAFAMREVRDDLQRIVDGYNETARLRAAIDYLRRKVDGYDAVFDVAEEIAAGTVSPDGAVRIADAKEEP